MKTIGITGGVGAGKSFVLDYIKNHYNAKIYLADDIANDLKLPGNSCYEPIISLFGNTVLDEDGTISKAKMAEMIFSDKSLLGKVNAIIHPAVKTFVLEEISKEKEKQQYDFFILEAALLIEEGYDLILDELWYIFADIDIRKQRLKESRNYSDEKIDNIMKNQLSEEEFQNKCKVTIINNGDTSITYSQIDKYLGEDIHAKR